MWRATNFKENDSRNVEGCITVIKFITKASQSPVEDPYKVWLVINFLKGETIGFVFYKALSKIGEPEQNFQLLLRRFGLGAQESPIQGLLCQLIA